MSTLNDIELIGFVAKAEGTEDVSDYYAVGIIQDSNNKDVLIPIHIDSNDAIFDEINDYYKEINENDGTASLIKDCCGQAKKCPITATALYPTTIIALNPSFLTLRYIVMNL